MPRVEAGSQIIHDYLTARESHNESFKLPNSLSRRWQSEHRQKQRHDVNNWESILRRRTRYASYWRLSIGWELLKAGKGKNVGLRRPTALTS